MPRICARYYKTCLFGLLIAACLGARAQAQMQAFGKNGVWETSGYGASDPACSVSGNVGPGTLTLTALGAAPGYVHLQLAGPSSNIPADVSSVVIEFAGSPSVSLHNIPGGAGNVLINLTAATLPAWMHGFTAAQSATISFPGTSAPPWRFALQGTTAAVNAMQKCVTDEHVAGVPLPFKSGAVVPVVAAGSGCLAYDPAISDVTGTVRVTTGYGPPNFGDDPAHDEKFQYAYLQLDTPACVNHGEANQFDDASGVKTMELFLPDHGQIFDAKPWLGRRVKVAGRIEQAMSDGEAATPRYINITHIGPAP